MPNYTGMEWQIVDKYEVLLQMALNIIAPGTKFTVSTIVDEAITDVLINKYGENWREKREAFLESYNALRKNFRVEAYRDDIPYFYSMYYLPLNIPKVQSTFLDLLKRKRLPKHIEILDVGSSVGTTAFAILDLTVLLDNLSDLLCEEPIFESIGLSFIEGSEDNIKVFNENLSYFKGRMSSFILNDKIVIKEPLNIDITKHFDISEKFDVIVFSNILNELPYEKRKKSVLKLSQNLNENGSVIIIEPATESKAKDLNRLKYEVTQESKLNCIAPCGVSEACKDCWIFRTENSVRNGLIKYVDDIYEGDLDNEDFFNERLKWNYVILTNDVAIKNISNLNTIQNNTKINCNFYIVSNYDRNQYRVCDGKSGRYSYVLDVGDYPVDKFNFGDIVNAENVIIEKIEQIHYITLNENSKLTSRFKFNRSQKLTLGNIKESSLKFILKRQWGFEEFRDGQFDIIKRALSDIDTIGILPTGSGKSLCFQLPAMIKTGASIVISPLKSLIKDQVDNLYRIGFEYVAYMDSSQDAKEKKEILNRFRAGFLKLLYIAPERLQIREFQEEIINTMKDVAIDYFIIDEAHCASEWGHDFRPAYLKVVDVKNKLGGPTLLALTATASPRVREDIAEIFKIESCNTLLPRTFDRPEISLQVKTVEIDEPKEQALLQAINGDIPNILRKDSIQDVHRKGSGIVFTIYANPDPNKRTYKFGTKYIADVIREECSVDTDIYHSKMPDEKRIETQNAFKKDRVPLLVSTKGFGMGIDKANIDYIVHMCYSNSLEAYYQEVGRAGRDREHAHALVVARRRHPDCLNQSKQLGNNEPMCVGGWNCAFSENGKCDYGMQARFISDEYRTPNIMHSLIYNFICRLENNAHGQKEFEIQTNSEEETKNFQKYLFYLQKHELVKDYMVEKYTGDKGAVISVILNKYFNEVNLNTIVIKIVERLMEFKKQKYSMLASMWEYIDSKSCRRQFLMDYFGDKANYNEGCQFCDIEGINEERAIRVRPDAGIELLYGELGKLLESKSFSYENASEIRGKAYKDNVHESIKIRCMKHLEDYPNNIPALYFTGIISMRRDKKQAYGANQIYACVENLCEKNDYGQAAFIVNEVCDIDEEFAFKLAVKFDVLNKNIEQLDVMMEKLQDRNKKAYLYKSYFLNRFTKVNQVLERSKEKWN